MKTIIAFFVMIYNWFISLFERSEKEILIEPLVEVPRYGNPVTPSHNNRKTKKGRFVQYINVGFNRQRAIYHSAKN